jgi:6-oxocamphor hydrolase
MSAIYRTYLDEYAPKYSDFLKLRRENGILEVQLHTRGEALRWGLEVHRGIIPAMADINNDPETMTSVLSPGTKRK